LLEFAFYRLMANATCLGETDNNRPSSSKPDKYWSKLFCDELLQIYQIAPGDTLDASLKKLLRWNDRNRQLRENTLEILQDGITAKWFDQRLNTLRDAFQEWLPMSLAKHLLPRQIWDQNGRKIESGKKNKSGGYGLALDKAQITID